MALGRWGKKRAHTGSRAACGALCKAPLGHDGSKHDAKLPAYPWLIKLRTPISCLARAYTNYR